MALAVTATEMSRGTELVFKSQMQTNDDLEKGQRQLSKTGRRKEENDAKPGSKICFDHTCSLHVQKT